MALKVFKADEASRDYENDFFRKFSGNLVEVFKKEKLDGILIGHPTVPANKYLKPDCVLITSNRLVIIDFKNHGGKIWLPDSSSFENAPWRHDDTIVDGGSSINPFEQLKKQRQWIEELIGEKTYGRFGIACVVCFQKDMTIMNEVPGKYQAWFSVTNKFQCINRIRDIIGVKPVTKEGVDIKKVFSYFEAKPYYDYQLTNFDALDNAIKADKRRAEAEKREYEAKRRVAELEKEIRAMNHKEAEFSILQAQLTEARDSARIAEEKARKAIAEFDEKNHDLEVATQEAEKAKAEASRAREEKERVRIETAADIRKAKFQKEKAAIEAEANNKNNRVKLAITLILAIVALVGIAVWIVTDWQEQKRQEQIEQEAAEQLEEDYRNGRKCLPAERVPDFVGSTICVDYYVGYINSNSYYIYLDQEKNGQFQTIIPIKQNIITKANAKDVYLNKHIEVRGLVKKYNDSYEIVVTDLDQIRILES